MKFYMKSLNTGIESISLTSPTGINYVMFRDVGTEVVQQDEEYFKNQDRFITEAKYLERKAKIKSNSFIFKVIESKKEEIITTIMNRYNAVPKVGTTAVVTVDDVEFPVDMKKVAEMRVEPEITDIEITDEAEESEEIEEIERPKKVKRKVKNKR